MLLLNIFLSLSWGAVTADFEPLNLLFGFSLGFLILYVLRGRDRPDDYFSRVRRVFRLLVILVWEVIKANLRVAWDVLTPTHHMKPAILAIPLDVRRDESITLLAQLITLTPGTLSLDVSTDRKVLYIHAMYATDLEGVRREIKEIFEREVKGVFE